MCNASICNASVRKHPIVAAFFTVLTLLAPTLWAAEAPTSEPLAVSPPQAGPALCSPSPTADAVPMAPCEDGFCTVGQFSPACGVGCCEYTCSPDSSCTGVDPIPPEAC